MSKQAFDKKMETLEALRAAPATPSTVEQLGKALKDRNNFLVSKAAALVGELGLQELTPDLRAAFDRFLVDAVKSDPQCWAKNAIVKSLKNLGHDEPQVYLRGLKHFQLEPVWGGRADTAAALRGACALALAGCALDRITLLTHLVDLLADPEKPVRVDAARAIDQVSGFESGGSRSSQGMLSDEPRSRSEAGDCAVARRLKATGCDGVPALTAR